LDYALRKPDKLVTPALKGVLYPRTAAPGYRRPFRQQLSNERAAPRPRSPHGRIDTTLHLPIWAFNFREKSQAAVGHRTIAEGWQGRTISQGRCQLPFERRFSERQADR